VARGSGRLQSYLTGLLSYIITIILGAAGRVVSDLSVLLPARMKQFDCKYLLLAYYAGVKEECVSKSSEAFKQISGSDGIPVGRVGADIQFGGGYSEEACSLLRKNLRVDPVRITDYTGASREKYDFVIVSNIINLLPTNALRQEVIGKINEIAKPGAWITFLCTNSSVKDIRIYLSGLRNWLWGLFLQREAHGGLNDIFYREHFIKHNFRLAELEETIKARGFKVVRALRSRQVIAVAAIK